MGFMVIFLFFIFVVLLIGFYPTLKRFFFSGDLKQNLIRLFFWLISAVITFIAVFQFRIAYQLFEEYEEFWQAMMIVENAITMLSIIFSVAFSLMIFQFYKRDIMTRFFLVTSLQGILYALFNLLELFIFYQIYELYSISLILQYVILLIISLALYFVIYFKKGYSLNSFLAIAIKK